MGVSLNLNKLVDKAYEDKTINELLDAPPSALEGLTPKHDELLAEVRHERDRGGDTGRSIEDGGIPSRGVSRAGGHQHVS